MKLKDIKSIDDVTLVELLEILEKELGINVEDFLLKMFTRKMEYKIKDLLDLSINEFEEILPSDIEKELKNNKLKTYIAQSGMNNSKKVKEEILLNIYINQPIEKKQTLSEIKNLLLKDKDYLVCVDIENKNGEIKYDIVMNGSAKKVEDIKNANLRNLVKLSINEILSIEDLSSIVKYKSLDEAILEKLLLDFNKKNKILKNSIEDLSEDNTDKVRERIEKIVSELERRKDPEDENEFKQYFKDFLMNNTQYIDTNKLLMNSATRLILSIKTKKGETNKYIHLNETGEEPELAMKTSIYFLRNLYNELKRNTKAKNMIYSLYGKDGEKVIDVYLEYIKDFLSRCTEDNYLTDANIQEIHEKIKAGELPESLEERRIANIDIDDLLNLSKSFELQEDKEGKEKLKECSVDLINYLKNEKLLSDEGIIELYIEGKFSKDILENIELPDISDKYYINTYKRLYGETLNDRNLEKIKKFSRFANYCDNASKNGKLDKYDMFLDFMEEYGEDNILDLYKLEAISLEECVDYVGTDILDKMFESTNRTIQPIELRKLYYDGVLDFNKMSSLINKIPTEEEKYMTIITIFPDEEDSKIRKDLIDNTIVVDSSVQGNGKRKGKDIDIDNDDKDKGKNYKKHITDSTYRFQLIKNLDEKYYAEMTKDGHIVLTLPKFKKVIIEKILDKNRQEGYGAATYILDEDYYRENEEEINQEGKIDRTKLVETNKNNEAKKIRHTIRTWGKDVKTYFESLQGTEYTKEESEKIDEIIEKIKNSERLVGD